jgi:hypothetical protein
MEPNLQARRACAIRTHATTLFAAAAVCLTIAIAAPARAADALQPKAASSKASEKYQVVYHVTTDDQRMWNQSLNNIRQMQKVLGKDNVEIELVVNGWGIGMLKMDSVVGNRVDEAVANGVKVVACQATMADRKLTKEDMLNSIGYVPGGVIEAIQKQKAGYAYLKP